MRQVTALERDFVKKILPCREAMMLQVECGVEIKVEVEVQGGTKGRSRGCSGNTSPRFA